jgi:hypothetical protein
MSAGKGKRKSTDDPGGTNTVSNRRKGIVQILRDWNGERSQEAICPLLMTHVLAVDDADAAFDSMVTDLRADSSRHIRCFIGEDRVRCDCKNNHTASYSFHVDAWMIRHQVPTTCMLLPCRSPWRSCKPFRRQEGGLCVFAPGRWTTSLRRGATCGLTGSGSPLRRLSRARSACD